ncbi:ARM repeat-containing protein [Mytilinidion resinicola]|uniref:ARM repeat-containing protein n=1 Tax=Mytilinidion resinicola TaxID=574789 RepID=A0A6A6Z8I1_9PEZI|nr:ARM repeat-containing protein [Mytilinidion resinicola]KAF2817326.1 ARM repeat-containing protein [Mytilinidion resinicola]
MEVEGLIEVPGEANPLTEGILFLVLKSAASNNPQQIQTGTKQLQTWETKRGFYPLLQTVFMDSFLPKDIRYLAIIQLKIGIDKYWRKTASNAISKEDKAVIRTRLLQSGINEADQRLALQNALVVAKIARFEYPNEWPDAITSIIQILRSASLPGANRLYLPRALLILLHIIKELSTGRLMRTRANLQSVTPEIFSVLGQVYVQKVQRWQAFLQDGGDDEGGALEDIEHSLLAIKLIRRLLTTGYEFPNRDSDVPEFWGVIRAQFGDFLTIATHENSPLSPDVQELVEKHLMQLSKLHLEMAQVHPQAFVLLPDTLNLVRDYWGLISKLGETYGSKSPDISKIGTDGDELDEPPLLERLALKGLLLIRACLKMVFYPAQVFRYRHPQEKEERTHAIQYVKTELFTEELVRDMMSVIVSRYFVFRPSDLRMWEEEPDEWEKMEEGGEDYEFSIRLCSEKLFLDLAKNFKDILIQPLLQVFYSVATPDNENILFKDSVYTAVGLAADVLHDQLDFDAFISSTLIPEIQKQKPGYNILRRRISILIGHWISVKVSDQNKPLVYQIFQHLLDKSDPLNDQVVRITAGRQLKNIADEWEFKAVNFLPYAPDTLSRLMALITEVELPETKMALLNTISSIVERLEHNITPYADNIISLLPPLWEQSGEEHLMKQAILTMLCRLTNAMKADSRKYHSSFLPIIRNAIDPNSDTQVYLLEDALDLWSSILAQTPSAPEPTPPELLELLPHLLPLYDQGTDILRKVLEITEAYLLLAPASVLADSFRRPLLNELTSLLGSLKPDANGTVTHLMELFVRGADGFGGENAVQFLVGDIITSGFFAKVMEGLNGAWHAHQSHGPNRQVPDHAVDGVVETDYLSVLARIGLASPRVLVEAVATVGGGLEPTLDWLLEEWFSHVENMGDPPNRKLTCLTLTRLLETGQPWILGRLQSLMAVWTDVVRELTDEDEDKSKDFLLWDDQPAANTLPNDPEAPEDVRRRDLIYSDPVHRINLISFLREHLQAAIQAAGGMQQFQQEWLERVDKDIVRGFGELGIL